MTLTEVRILSRGGQGGVTAAKLLASAGHLSGKYVQAIPKYGAERKGAPIFADVRISDEHVKTHAPVIPFNTHSWIVLEPSLVDTIPFDEFKLQLQQLTDYVVPAMRRHIFIENNLILPLAIELIDDTGVWDHIKRVCDEIGYCGYDT